MKPKKKDGRVNRSLFSLWSYLTFFLLISSVVTCCFLLFLRTANIEIRDLRHSAIVTFGNVLFLSLICCVIDGIRRKITIERPVKRILNATQQLAKGNFDARIKPLHSFESKNEFDAIIDDFNLMAAELASTETLRTDFIANVSHELKTPLAVIANYAALLQHPDTPEAQRVEYAKTVTQATRRLSELITNILKLSKLENQQIFPEAEAYNLGEQLRGCLLNFEDLWEEKALTLDVDIDDVPVAADGELLSLVWNNLISNAVKFTPAQGRIAVSLKAQNGVAVVKIADTGCGISPEVGAHIFEKFYQGDASHATQGNGLGLPLQR